MHQEARKYLFDIHDACRRLVRFTTGKTFEQYERDELLQAGVERQFEIIGEAMSKLVRHDPKADLKITDQRAIIAFRNQVIHGYDVVDNRVVWGIVETKLPILCREVAALLGERSET